MVRVSGSLLALLMLATVCVSLAFARQCAKSDDLVKSLPGHGGDHLAECSYASSVTVDKKHDGELFYWLFESRSNPAKDPVVVWLNGGPGCSSLFGSFMELGPYSVSRNGTAGEFSLHVNKYSWNSHANLLVIDQPVGTGMAFLGNKDGYVENEKQVAAAMITLLEQVVKRNPSLKGRKLFLSGESYAGRYIPATARAMIEGKFSAMQLSGLLIGDGLVDATYQRIVRGQQARAAGMMTAAQYRQMESINTQCLRQALQTQEGTLDAEAADEDAAAFVPTHWEGELGTNPCDRTMSFIHATSGGVLSYDMRVFKSDYDESTLDAYLSLPELQHAVHARPHPYQGCNDTVGDHLFADRLKSALDDVRFLLHAQMRILLYNGNFDLVDGPLGTENWLAAINSEFYDSDVVPRRWLVDGDVHGNVVENPLLSFLVVYNAGHMVPMAQPKATNSMLRTFITGKAFCAEHDKTCNWVPDVCKMLDNCNAKHERGSCVSGRCVCAANFYGAQCENTIYSLADKHTAGKTFKLYPGESVMFQMPVQQDIALDVTAVLQQDKKGQRPGFLHMYANRDSSVLSPSRYDLANIIPGNETVLSLTWGPKPEKAGSYYFLVRNADAREPAVFTIGHRVYAWPRGNSNPEHWCPGCVIAVVAVTCSAILALALVFIAREREKRLAATDGASYDRLF